MLFKDKVLKFFQSSYRQNTKFNHSYLGYLQIFFERGNKFKSSFAALGNTFRNSKWSDLRVTNIKTSFTKTWLRTITSIILFLVLLFVIWALLVGEGFELISFDGLNMFTAAFFSGLYRLTTMSWTTSNRKQVYEQLLSNEIQDNNDNYLSTSISKKLNNSTKNSSIKFSTNNQKSSKVTDVMYNAVSASNSIKTLDSPTVKDLMEWIEPTNNFDPETYVKYGIVPNLVNHKSPKSTFFVNRSLKNGISTRFNNIESEWLNTPGSYYWLHLPTINSNSITLSLFNKLTDSNVSLTTNSLNLKSNIDLFKQDRWLMKNTLLSNNNLTKTFNLTQAKKLIGSNLSQSNVSTSNIWVSNSVLNSKLASNMYSQLYSNLDDVSFLQNKGVYTPSLENINFQENSFFWLLQKYTFTNQLRFNTVTYSNNLVTNNIDTLDINNQNIFKLLTQLKQVNLSSKYTNIASYELSNFENMVTSQNFTSAGNFTLVNVDLDSLLPAVSTLAEKVSTSSLSTNSNITTHNLGLVTPSISYPMTKFK